MNRILGEMMRPYALCFCCYFLLSLLPPVAKTLAAEQVTDVVAAVQKAAEQGDALAQSNLGRMYVDGIGVPKDEAQAVYWLQKAAAQGQLKAQETLGQMHTDGKT